MLTAHPYACVIFCVLFLAEGELTLKNISFECNTDNRMLAIVGPVGAGKASSMHDHAKNHSTHLLYHMYVHTAATVLNLGV